MTILAPILRAVLAVAGLLGGVGGALLRWEWQRRRGGAAFRRALHDAGLPDEAARELTREYVRALSLGTVFGAVRQRERHPDRPTRRQTLRTTTDS